MLRPFVRSVFLEDLRFDQGLSAGVFGTRALDSATLDVGTSNQAEDDR